MDFCSINVGVINKVKELAQKDQTFIANNTNILTPSSSASIKAIKDTVSKLNDTFGGEVISFKSGVYSITPAKNVVNAYLLSTKKDLIEEARELSQVVVPKFLLSAYNQDIERALMEISQQIDSTKEDGGDTVVRMYGKELTDLARKIFPDTKNGETIEDYRFKTDTKVGLNDLVNNNTFYNLKSGHDFKTLQEVVLQRMANTTANPLYRNIISKLNNKYYITSTDKLGVNSINENIKRFNNFLYFNNIPTNLFRLEEFTTASGTKGLRISKTSTSINDEIEETKKTDRINSIIGFLSERFGYKGEVVSVSRSEFKTLAGSLYSDRINSAVIGGKIYLVTSSNTNDITSEELMHPFINALAQANPSLFSNLLTQAKKDFPILTQQTLLDYKDQKTHIQQQEIVTKALARIFNKEQEEHAPISLKEAIKDFAKWMLSAFKDLFNYYNNTKYTNVHLDTLSPELTLQELSHLINTTDSKFDTEFGPTFYNKKTMSEDMYQSIYNSLTDKALEASIGNIVVRLPDTIRDIKKALTEIKDEKNRQDLNNILQDIYNITDNENRVKTQFRTVSVVLGILNKIDDKITLIDNSALDSNVKLIEYNALYKVMKSVEPFQGLMTDLYNTVNDVKGQTPELKEFYNMLSKAISIPKTAESRITGLLRNPIIDILADYNEPFYRESLTRLNKEKFDLEAKKNNPNLSLAEKARISKKISNVEEDIKKLPTKETFSKIFDGKFKDANAISLWLESGIINGHPLVSSLMSMIEDAYYKAGQSMTESRTIIQKHLDEIQKVTGESLRDQSKMWAPVTVTVKRPKSVIELDANDKPKFEYVEQRALLNFYDGKYIQEKEERDTHIQYLFDQWIKAANDKDITKEEKFKALHKAAIEERFDFNKANSERQFLDEVYDMFDLLDKVVGKDENGNDITIKGLKGDIYTAIENAEHHLRKNFNSDARQQAIDEIALLKAELRELKNPYVKGGTEKKTGIDAKIVEIITEYDDLHRKYGDYIITPEAQSEFDADMQILKDQYSKGVVDQAEYERRKSQMTKNEISPQYFDAINDLHAQIAEIMERVMAIPQLAKSFNPEDKEQIKEGYQKIREIVKPYRDIDGVIDGQLISKAVPDLVQLIKTIQESVEKIKQATQKLGSLSTEENMEISRLYKIFSDKTGTVSQQDKNEALDAYNILAAKKADAKRYAANNAELLNELNTALKELGALNETENTHYYYEELQNQQDALKTDDTILKEVDEVMHSGEFLSPDGRIYNKGNLSKWYERVMDHTTNEETFKPMFDPADELATGYDEMRNIILNHHTFIALRSTEWWENNHFNQLRWDSKSRSYFSYKKPIYIWQMQNPANPNFIIRDQPSILYRKYQIKDTDVDDKGNKIPGYTNPNYRLIGQNIAAPKAGKYVNTEYSRMKDSKASKDIAYYNFLEDARKMYQKSQDYYQQVRKMGDILPAIVKTHGENTVNTTNYIIKSTLNGEILDILKTNTEETDNDNALLLGGSMSKTSGIPVRYTGKMDTSKQSANIPAMLLLFELAASTNNQLNQKIPIIETIQNLASKVAVTQSQNIAQKTNFVQGMRDMFSKNGLKVESTKDTQHSVLSKTIDSFVDMFVHGRTTKSSILNVGGVNIDINKITGSALGFVAKSIFIGNTITAVKNSVATRVQTMIQANVKQNVYSQANFNKANAQAAKYVPQLMRDFTKVGDKSLIGQVLDYFMVMPESLNGVFTDKSEYTILKEKMTILSSPKNMSEFEVMLVQFLTFANNKMVDVNGKKIPLGNIEDIFEKGKNGVVKFKKGVNFSNQDEASFIKIFRKYTREIAGAYRPTERTQLETHWAGKAVMYMHKYLAPGISNRYAGRRYSIEEGDITEGYYSSTFKNILSLFKDYSGNVLEKWQDMSPMEQAHALKLLKEFGFIMSLWILTSMMGGNDKKKELQQNSYAYNYVLTELMATKTETETFAFAIGSGTDDIIRIAKSPVIAMQQVTNIYKLFALVPMTAIGSEDAYYKNNVGLHNQGDSKLFAQFLKIIGYTGKTWNGPEMVKQQQMIQTLR